MPIKWLPTALFAHGHIILTIKLPIMHWSYNCNPHCLYDYITHCTYTTVWYIWPCRAHAIRHAYTLQTMKVHNYNTIWGTFQVWLQSKIIQCAKLFIVHECSMKISYFNLNNFNLIHRETSICTLCSKNESIIF